MSLFRLVSLSLVVLMAVLAWSREKPDPAITMMWPNSSRPSLEIVFGKFVQQGPGYQGQRSFISDVVVRNVSAKRIPRASLSVQLFDKEKVRIGDAVLNINDLDSGESTKIAFQFFTVGLPTSLTLAAHNDNGIPTSFKTVPLKIVSVPPGAKLKVDGQDAGTTPKIVDLIVGTHLLQFSKEGYATGSTPVDIAPDETAGGEISFELGGLSRDTVELRDGTSVVGDVMSVSMDSVVVRVDGQDQTYDRNRVAKIMLVERESPHPTTSAVPTAASK